MHRVVTHRPRPERDETGAVAIVVAVSLVAVLVIVAMVLDFGLVRVDRQVDKASADYAALAGAHGLNTGDGSPHAYAGVCTAIRYLQRNDYRFAALDSTTGWTNGQGTATASGCTDVGLRNKQCKGSDLTTWAVWHWAGTYQGLGLDVTIQSGYVIPTNVWAEDALPASASDVGDASYGGCDQLAVTIDQTRQPGLGSLATTSDLRTAIRSVARVRARPGATAPALLLLKQTGCPVLKTGSSGGASYIHVLGAVTSDGKSQAGTIHSDSDGVGCTGGNNSWLFGGLSPGGIAAYAAPLVSNPTQPDPTKPGQISAVAAANGITGLPLRDSNLNVYGSSLLAPGVGGSTTDVTSMSLVTRRLVDERYFSGVKGAITAANTVFSTGATSTPSGWTPLTASNVCKPTQAEVTSSVTTANANTSGKLYIGCTGSNGFEGTGPTLQINASEVYFKGMVAPASNVALSLPNATKVYIGNHLDKPNAISISNTTSLSVNNAFTNLDSSGNCSTGLSTSKAALFVRAGPFKQTGGLMRLCRTTVFMMGGSSTGCVPATTGTAPNISTPCGGSLGTGQFSQNGGDINWTAPNALDVTTDANGNATAAATTAWQDVNGPEDLALWSESGTSTNSNFSMGGGGATNVRGVYMVPNAGPFSIGGNSAMTLTNAQYVASSIELNGSGTSITMSVDPNSAITLPEQDVVGLVR